MIMKSAPQPMRGWRKADSDTGRDPDQVLFLGFRRGRHVKLRKHQAWIDV
jgi:hypothetical protein